MSAFPARHDLLDTRLRRFTRLLHGVDRGDVDAVHRTRVASRRLRELLPVLLLQPDTVKKLGRRMRRITGALGHVRELDVLGLLIDELQGAGRYPARALKLLRADVDAARRDAAAHFAKHDVAHDLQRLAAKLARLTEELETSGTTPEQRRAVRWAIDARVTRRAARLKNAMDAAGPVYLAERLHGVRIAVKKLRYGVELAAEIGESRRAELSTLKRAQQLLGRMHDLQVLVDRARRVQGSLTPPDFTVWRELDIVIAALETSCRRLHARYVRERTALFAVCDRLSGSRAARHHLARTAAV